MGVREVIAGAIQQWGLRDAANRMAQHAVDQLHAAGYVILSPDEVRGIREAALEEAAKLADERAACRERLYSENGRSINAAKAVEAEETAFAIRALRAKEAQDATD